MKPIDILKNKEIFELLAVIGLEFGKPATNLNYGKIAIMTDADVDGAAIFCLLLNLFSNWPELFHQNRILKTVTPLYHCIKGKREKVFYTKAEFDLFDSSGYDVSYFKGIGSLSTELYSECINNPNFIQIDYPEGSSDKLEMSFGDDASKRKTWMIN
jgi:DNA gyrase/topoisomerase IV subunit B